MYTKSFEDFVKQFSDSAKQKKLYTSLHKDKLYTKSFIEFQDQFFGGEITQDINQGQPQQEQPIFETDEMGNKIPVAPSQEVISQNQTVPELQEGRENSFETTLDGKIFSDMKETASKYFEIQGLLGNEVPELNTDKEAILEIIKVSEAKGISLTL